MFIMFIANKPRLMRVDSSLPADVLWGLFLFVTHSILPTDRGEKWMRDEQKQTPQDVCGEARWIAFRAFIRIYEYPQTEQTFS